MYSKRSFRMLQKFKGVLGQLWQISVILGQLWQISVIWMQCGRHEGCISHKWASMWWRSDLLCLSSGGINKNIHLPIFYGYSISGKPVSNFPDKYFGLAWSSFCLKQFHLFQNYTGWGSSLITALGKFWNQWQWCEQRSGFNFRTAQAFCCCIWAQGWPKISVSGPAQRGKSEHLCSKETLLCRQPALSKALL